MHATNPNIEDTYTKMSVIFLTLFNTLTYTINGLRLD